MNDQNNPQSIEPVQSSKNILAIIISVIITTLVIGGSVFTWQKFTANKTTANLQYQHQQEIKNLQQQISQLKTEPKTPENITPELNSGAVKNLLYKNDPQNYSVQFPSNFEINDYSLWNGSKFLHQIEFREDSTNYFMIRAREEQENDYYLDHEAVGKTTLGGLPANKYVLEKGYCDGPGCSPPMTVIKTYKDGVRYAIEFYNVTDINAENQNILSSFKFIR